MRNLNPSHDSEDYAEETSKVLVIDGRYHCHEGENASNEPEGGITVAEMERHASRLKADGRDVQIVEIPVKVSRAGRTRSERRRSPAS